MKIERTKEESVDGKQTLAQALADPYILRALDALAGHKARGGGPSWQARMALLDVIPKQQDRVYEWRALIEGYLTVTDAGVYARKPQPGQE